MVHKLDDTFTSPEEFLKLLRSGFHSRGSRLVSLGCDLGVRMFCKSPGNADIQPSVRTTGNSQLELEPNHARQPSTQGYYPPSHQAPGGLCAGRPLERVSSRVRRGAQDDPPHPPPFPWETHWVLLKSSALPHYSSVPRQPLISQSQIPKEGGWPDHFLKMGDKNLSLLTSPVHPRWP